MLSVDSARKKESGRLDRLYVSIVIMCIIANAIAIHFSPPRSVIRFPRLHTCVPCLLRVFYSLPTVQETRSKNAQLSRATTSCA